MWTNRLQSDKAIPVKQKLPIKESFTMNENLEMLSNSSKQKYHLDKFI